MSRRSSKPAAARSSGSDEEFVMVTPRGQAAAAAVQEELLIDEATRIKGTPEQEAAYERALDTKYRADLLGVDLPPVAPPGYIIAERVEPSKPPTFWTLLFKRAENKTALQQLYFTTVLMITLPLGMMALSYFTIFAGMDEDARLMWAGFGGVLGVNIVAVGFGLFAYYDNSDDDEAGANDVPAPGSAEEAAAKAAKWEAWEAAQIAAEGREDRERLQIIKDKFEQAQGRTPAAAAAAGSKDAEAESETAASAGSRSSGKKKSAALSRRSKKDAALEDESAAAAAAEETAAPEESAASGSRVSRSRSKKA